MDEAHTCAFGAGRGGRHQRHELLQKLAADPERHLILVTATPHSGKEDAFRSLLTFLDRDFADLPEDLTGEAQPAPAQAPGAALRPAPAGRHPPLPGCRHALPRAAGRRRTPTSSAREYKTLFERVLDYARETRAGCERRGSSTSGCAGGRRWPCCARWHPARRPPRPPCATAPRPPTPRRPRRPTRSAAARCWTWWTTRPPRAWTSTPGSDTGRRRRRQPNATAAGCWRWPARPTTCMGDKDAKLKKAVELVKDLLNDGYRPIVFCRFIPTAEYVADELRKRLPKDVEVAAVTGAAAARRARGARRAVAAAPTSACWSAPTA